MSRMPELKNLRNKAIKEAYDKLEAETVVGMKGPVRKYRREAILAILSKRFYLAPDTISNIVLAPDDSQLNLFEGK